ncbi:MAG: NUDIX hydrolase [Butyrivibrio sp.]|nr:NUDIX hydrolase [Butyrivibrio sp.]
MDLRWKIRECEHLAQDEWIDFRKCVYELPDGSQLEPVYNYSKHSYSIIVPVTKDGRYVCVRQYRHGIDSVTCEFPAGAIEYQPKGGTSPITYENIIATKEEAFAAAKRELEEETGFVSGEWKHLYTAPGNPTLSNSLMYIYLAKNCTRVSGQQLDNSEFLNVVLLTEDELKTRMSGGDFLQPHHLLAWYLSKDAGL